MKQIKKATRLATLGTLAYGVMQDPKGRAMVGRLLSKGASLLREADSRHSNPQVNTFTGKPKGTTAEDITMGASGMNKAKKVEKLDQLADKIPAGTFGKAAAMVDKGHDKLRDLDRKMGMQQAKAQTTPLDLRVEENKTPEKKGPQGQVHLS